MSLDPALTDPLPAHVTHELRGVEGRRQLIHRHAGLPPSDPCR